MELDLLGGIFRLCLWLSSVPSQDKDDGDEEEIRASAETSDQTQEDDPGEKRGEQRDKDGYVDRLEFSLEQSHHQQSHLYLLDS